MSSEGDELPLDLSVCTRLVNEREKKRPPGRVKLLGLITIWLAFLEVELSSKLSVLGNKSSSSQRRQ